MLKCQQKIVDIAKAMGGSVDDDDPNTLYLDAKRGYEWYATGCSTIVVHGASAFGDSWWIDACKDAMRDLHLGMHKLDPDNEHDLSTIEDTENYRDEPWRAGPDDPAWVYPDGPRETYKPGAR